MECSQRIGPALGHEASIGVADFRAEQGVVYPSLRLADVEIGGHDVVVAGEHDRRAAGENRFGMGGEPCVSLRREGVRAKVAAIFRPRLPQNLHR